MVKLVYEKGYGLEFEAENPPHTIEIPRHIRAEELAAYHPCSCGCGGLRDRDERPLSPGISPEATQP